MAVKTFFNLWINNLVSLIHPIIDTGYPHDGHADKDSYSHDSRPNKDSYPHDRHNQYVMLSL